MSEGSGVQCKKYGVYTIQCVQGQYLWTIFRRYQQFWDLDKKLKDHKFLKKNDKSLPPKTGGFFFLFCFGCLFLFVFCFLFRIYSQSFFLWLFLPFIFLFLIWF